MVTWLAAPESVFQLCIVIAAFGVVIWTLELLAEFRSFRGNGLYSWSLLRYQHRFAVEDTRSARGIAYLLRYPNVLVVLLLRLASALALVFWVSRPEVRLVGIAGIFLTNLLLFDFWAPNKRGSDGLTQVIFGAFLLVEAGGESPAVLEAGLWFVALQTCISYCSNGLGKLGKPAWSRGTVIFDIANHRVCGSLSAARFLQARPAVARVLGWSAVAMECLFPLVLLTGLPGCLIFLTWGLVFHGLSAYAIGLNSFFWSYAATYPAVIYVSLRFQELIF